MLFIDVLLPTPSLLKGIQLLSHCDSQRQIVPTPYVKTIALLRIRNVSTQVQGRQNSQTTQTVVQVNFSYLEIICHSQKYKAKVCRTNDSKVTINHLFGSFFDKLQGVWNWVCRVCSCKPKPSKQFSNSNFLKIRIPKEKKCPECDFKKVEFTLFKFFK